MKELRLNTQRILVLLLLTVSSGCQEPNNTAPGAKSSATTASESSASSEPLPSDKSVATESPGDSERGHKLVTNCAACHGEHGEKSHQHAPFLAGQSNDYLYSALIAYQDGRRKHQQMRTAVRELTAQDLSDLSEYFAKQSGFSWVTDSIQTNIVGRAVSRGRVASTPCVDCHGLDGNSHIAEVPSLAGISPDYFIYAFDNYFSERRKGTIMKHFKHAVSWEMLHDLAQYYSSLPRHKSTMKVPGDVKRGEKLAASCAKCHGQFGETIVSSMPDLARQNPLYLVSAIRAYQSGKRQNALMKAEVKDLKDQAIKDIASYYASVTATPLPDTDAPTPNNPSNMSFDPIRDGESLATNCIACHGKQGNSEIPGIPSISALSPKYFVQALNEYRDGKRQHQMMQSFAKAIDRSQADKLAYYFYAQPRKPRAEQSSVTKPEVALLATCNGCHGDFGQGDKPTIPAISAQDPLYLQNALMSYRSGRRDQADMMENTKELNDDVIKQLSLFYSIQPPPSRSTQTFISPKELVDSKCARCHGNDGKGVSSNIPNIAGQSKQYLLTALLAYKSGDRVHTTMYAMTDVLTLSELEGVANYYASLKPQTGAQQSNSQ